MKETLKPIVIALLTWQAKTYLALKKPKVIAITGSVGKTTSKDMIYAALQNKFNVYRSEKSFNSEIGVPLTVLQLPNGANDPIVWAVNIIRGFWMIITSTITTKIDAIIVEVGTDRPGDIQEASKWLRPYISVFTALSKDPVHLEHFESRAQLFDEKKSLGVNTRDDGIIIYNGDDEFLPTVLSDLPQKKYSYGKNGEPRLQNYSISYSNGVPDGMIINLVSSDGTAEAIRLSKVAGDGYVYALLSACAVGSAMGMEFSMVANECGKNFIPEPGRGKLIPAVSETTVLDESYNSSPRAVRALFDTLGKFTPPQIGRKILILGDMKELGDKEIEIHKEIGREALAHSDILVFVGILANHMYEAALGAGADPEKTKHFDTADEAGEYVRGIVHPSDIISAKGSRHSIRLERALVSLVNNDEKMRLVQEYL